MVDRAAFREDALARFWRFVAERQAVWTRRVVAGEPPPWTPDPVLRRHRFTNVYRVLDPGTQYALRAILARDAPLADRLVNDVWYRLVGRRATHAHVGFVSLDDFDPAAFETALRERAEVGPVFTGAYTVSPYGWLGGRDKVANVARLLGEIVEAVEPLVDELAAADGPAAAYAALRGLPGVGNFLAYQVLVDLLTPLVDGDPVLSLSRDAWAAAGPGARRGLGVLRADGAAASDGDAMRWLHRNQTGAFARRGLAFDWLRDDGGDRIELGLPDVQNCCCEFWKYERAWRDAGGPRRRFRPSAARSVDALRSVYDGYPLSLDPGDYGGA